MRGEQIFVAMQGASNYTYVDASLSQSTDWTTSYVRAFAYFGGTARQTVSQNLRPSATAVRSRACRRSIAAGCLPIFIHALATSTSSQRL